MSPPGVGSSSLAREVTANTNAPGMICGGTAWRQTPRPRWRRRDRQAFDEAGRIARRAPRTQHEVRRTGQRREQAIIAEDEQTAVHERAGLDAAPRPRAPVRTRR